MSSRYLGAVAVLLLFASVSSPSLGSSGQADQAAKAEKEKTANEQQKDAPEKANGDDAIAVLMGKPPAELTIAATPLGFKLPDIPVSVPSTLLERRPDIAAAERMMQQENALIGAAVALYYPDISLSAMFGYTGTGGLFISLANEFLRFSATATQTIFNAGLFSAQVEAAMATHDLGARVRADVGGEVDIPGLVERAGEVARLEHGAQHGRGIGRVGAQITVAQIGRSKERRSTRDVEDEVAARDRTIARRSEAQLPA